MIRPRLRIPPTTPRRSPFPPKPSKAGERGAIAYSMVSIMVLLMIFSLGLYTLNEVHQNLTMENGRHVTALNLAEAGVDHIVWQLRQNPRWREVPEEQNVSLPRGQYSLQELVIGSSGVKGLKVRGCTPGMSISNAVCAEVYAEVAPVYATMVAGAFVGDRQVTVNMTSKVELDSYRSDNGSYDQPLLSGLLAPIVGLLFGSPDNSGPGTARLPAKGDDGDIATNNTQPSSVRLSGQYDIKGRVYYPSGAPASVVSATGTGTVGGIMANPVDTTFHPITPPPAGATHLKPINLPGIGTTALLNGLLPVLPPLSPGIYVIDPDKKGVALDIDKIPLNISASAQTVIYLNGKVSIKGGGIQNGLEYPPNLLLYGMSGCTSITFNGSSKFHGAIYAPDADVFLSGGDEYFGSIAAKTITVNGPSTKFHYDENLRDANGYVSAYHINSWTELR